MQHFTDAEQAGQVTPANENPHGTRHAVGIETNQTQKADSKHPGAAVQQVQQVQQVHAKATATLVAKCALAGITLIETTGDNGQLVFVASRGALTRHLASLDEVQNWLANVTGVSA